VQREPELRGYRRVVHVCHAQPQPALFGAGAYPVENERRTGFGPLPVARVDLSVGAQTFPGFRRRGVELDARALVAAVETLRFAHPEGVKMRIALAHVRVEAQAGAGQIPVAETDIALAHPAAGVESVFERLGVGGVRIERREIDR